MAISDAVMILSKCHRAASQAMNSVGKNLVPKGAGFFFCFWEFQRYAQRTSAKNAQLKINRLLYAAGAEMSLWAETHRRGIDARIAVFRQIRHISTRKCAKHWKTLQKRIKNASKTHQEQMKRICLSCGKEFVADNKRRKYCSYECRAAAAKLKRINKSKG